MKTALLLTILLIVTLITLIESRPLVAKRIVHAINAGSHMPKRSTQGFTYSRDQGYDEDTNAVDYSNDPNLQDLVIKYAKDQSIYLTERHGYNSFSYQLALDKEGPFTLILKFSEMYFDKPGRRVFHIRLGEQRVITGLDIFAKSGRFTAHDEYVEFKYANGIVSYKGQPCNGAIQDGKLVITFEKTEFDNPIIQGIILYSGSLDQTDFEELGNWKLNWERNFALESKKKEEQQAKLKEAKLKKQEKITVRSDHQDIEDDFEEIEVHNEEQQQEEEDNKVKQPRQTPPLKDLLMSPLGIVCMIGFFVTAFVLIQATFFEDNVGEKKTD